jgi:hypothetical protein
MCWMPLYMKLDNGRVEFHMHGPAVKTKHRNNEPPTTMNRDMKKEIVDTDQLVNVLTNRPLPHHDRYPSPIRRRRFQLLRTAHLSLSLSANADLLLASTRCCLHISSLFKGPKLDGLHDEM